MGHAKRHCSISQPCLTLNVRRCDRAATTGAGLPFGAAVWAIADEGIVPAAGLSKSPTEYPPAIHLYAFASHLVFGLTAEVVRRAVRRAL